MRLKLSKCTPATNVVLRIGWVIIPTAIVTCGCCASLSTSFSGSGAPLSVSTDVPGGRTRTSAPTPLARLAESSSMPRLRPTSVRIRVTGTAIRKTLRALRIGLCFRFSTMSLPVTGCPFSGAAPVREASAPPAARRAEASDRVPARWPLQDHCVFVLRAVDLDVLGKRHAIVGLPVTVPGIGQDIPRSIKDELSRHAEIDTAEPDLPVNMKLAVFGFLDKLQNVRRVVFIRKVCERGLFLRLAGPEWLDQQGIQEMLRAQVFDLIRRRR